MTAEHLGPWEPMTVAAVAGRFDDAPFRWWMAGGHALEAHLSDGADGWRQHEDIDVGVCRQDAPALFEALHGWDIQIAASGELSPWDGTALDPDGSDHAGNNLWCRPTPSAPWMLDVLIGDGNDHDWIYRRDTSVHRPWTEAVLHSRSGLPYLAPEIQLLFKSKTIRPKDAVDAAHVIPELDAHRQTWLAAQLPPEHSWQTIIAAAAER